MSEENKLVEWTPLLSKLVWPFFIIIALIVFNKETKEMYDILLASVKSGRSVEIGGFIKLGEAADKTKISELSTDNIPIKGIGGSAGVVRKGSTRHLVLLQEELKKNPSKSINTLLLPDNIRYAPSLLKQYIATLGLKYVVFQRNGKFDGWISSSAFVAQLSKDINTVRYNDLKREIVGIRKQAVDDDNTVTNVLEQMQELHIDSIPVVDKNGRWLFFANRGEILARMMTNIMLEKK